MNSKYIIIGAIIGSVLLIGIVVAIIFIFSKPYTSTPTPTSTPTSTSTPTPTPTPVNIPECDFSKTLLKSIKINDNMGITTINQRLAFIDLKNNKIQLAVPSEKTFYKNLVSLNESGLVGAARSKFSDDTPNIEYIQFPNSIGLTTIDNKFAIVDESSKQIIFLNPKQNIVEYENSENSYNLIMTIKKNAINNNKICKTNALSFEEGMGIATSAFRLAFIDVANEVLQLAVPRENKIYEDSQKIPNFYYDGVKDSIIKINDNLPECSFSNNFVKGIKLGDKLGITTVIDGIAFVDIANSDLIFAKPLDKKIYPNTETVGTAIASMISLINQQGKFDSSVPKVDYISLGNGIGITHDGNMRFIIIDEYTKDVVVIVPKEDAIFFNPQGSEYYNIAISKKNQAIENNSICKIPIIKFTDNLGITTAGSRLAIVDFKNSLLQLIVPKEKKYFEDSSLTVLKNIYNSIKYKF